jgi:signal transduction histidine kinase/tetratricopeptide (TPR) repeat protein
VGILIHRKQLIRSFIKGHLLLNPSRYFSLLLFLFIPFSFVTLTAQDIDSYLTQLENKRTRQNAALELSKIYLSKENKAQALHYAQIATEKNDGEEIEAMINLASVYSHFQVFDTALQTYSLLIPKLADSNSIIDIVTRQANIQKATSDYSAAMLNYRTALNYYLHKAQKENASRVLNYIGSLYWTTGQHENANNSYDSAIALTNNNLLKAQVYNNKALNNNSLSNYDEAVLLHRKALGIAKNINDTNLVATSFIHLGNVYFRNNSYDSALNHYMNAKLYYTEIFDTAGLVKASINMANTLVKSLQYQDAIRENEYALGLLPKREKYQRISIYNSLGNIYNEIGEYAKTADYFFQSLRIASDINDNYLLAQTCNRLSQFFASLNNFEKAEQYLKQSIHYTEKLSNPSQLAYRLNQLGNLYYRFEDYTSALVYYKQTLDVRKELNDLKSIAQTYNNLGNTYRKSNNPQRALHYYLKALDLYVSINDKVQQCYVLNNLGNTEQEMQSDVSAIEYFTEAYNLSKEVDNKFILALTARKLGEYQRNKSNFQDAIRLFNESYTIGVKTNHSLLQQNALFQLYETHKEQNRLTEALDYFEKYTEIYQRELEKKNNQQIFETQLSYQLQLKSDTIRAIETDLFKSQENEKLKALEAKRYKGQRTLLFSLSLVTLIAGSLIFFLFLQNRKKNKLLDEAYQKTQQANLKLKKSEAVLKELNATKDKFFSIIGHDLRGPISGLMNLTGILNSNYDSLSNADLKHANLSIHESSKSLYALLENLLNWSRSQTGRIPFNPTRLNVHNLVAETFSALAINARDKQINLNNLIDKEQSTFGDEEMIKTVLRNLVSNGIKFTPENGTITIDSKPTQKGLQINVKDTGVGMPKEIKNKLFRIDEQVTLPGTNNEKGTGLGLVLCKEFVKKHKGKIWVDSKPEQGTTFSFTINYKA